MDDTSSRSEQQDGVRYELRSLTDRWMQPMGSLVLSTHGTADAALAAQQREPQQSTTGGGRSTRGTFVPNIVVRVDIDGSESPTVPKPVLVHRS